MNQRSIAGLELVVAIAEKELGPDHPATVRRREQLHQARRESDRRPRPGHPGPKR